MVTKTGNRMCSESELIDAVVKEVPNPDVIRQLLESTKAGDIILLKCENVMGPDAGIFYEVIGRIGCKFDPDGDVPQGLDIERGTEIDYEKEFVPYFNIRSYKKLVEETGKKPGVDHQKP